MILASVVLVLLYCFSCLCLGALLRRVLHFDMRFGINATLAFLLGSAVMANLWLILLMLPGQWFTPAIVWVILLVPLVGFYWAGQLLREQLESLKELFKDLKELLWAWRGLAVAGLALLVLTAITALLPPKGDGAAFYMAYPKVLAHWGTLKPMVGGFGTFSQIGLHGEMHFAALILIGSDQAASLMNVAMLLSIIVLLNGCAKIETAPTYRPWILLILVLTSSAVTSLVAGGKVDLFGAAMGVAACCIVLNDLYRLDSKAASPLLAGLFAGFAIIAKLSLLATLVPMLALLVLWGGLYHRRILCSVYWRNVGVMVLAGVVACIPHMVKNQLLFGEPLAPVISSASWLQQEWYTPTQQATLWAVYPLAAFLGALPGMGGAMSAGILALWPVVLLTGRARGRRILTSRSFQAAIVSVVALVIWVVLRPGVFALRYFLPPLLLLAVLPAVETDRLLRDLKTLRALKAAIWLVLAMALAASFNRPEGHPGEAWDYLRGKLSAVEFADAPGRAAAVLTAHADPSERVWLASPYAYFLRAESLANASGRDDYRHVSAHPAQAGWTYLYRQGFRYIYVGPLGGSIGRGGSTLTLGWRLGQSSLDSTDLPDDLQLVAMDLQSVAGEPITPGSRDYPAYGVFRLERTGPEEKNENSALNLDANR